MNESQQSGTAIVADARHHVRSFIEVHGRIAVTILAGGTAAALGTIVPFAHTYGFFGGGSYAIIQSGFYGLLLLCIAALLGILPVFFKQHLRFKLAAFGVCCALFGVFFAMWLAASGIAGTLGGGVGGFSLGFYLSLFGYAAMVVGYYLMQSQAEENRA